MGTFTHLHVHSHYSLLDGLAKIPELVQNAKAKGFTSLALTDHGAMYGIVEFYKECRDKGISPILGVEAYLAPRKLTDKQHKLDDQTSHLVLLARNMTGYKNLLKLVTIAHLQGFYYKPRIDHETLAQYHDGLVALSACLKGEIPQALAQGDDKKVKELVQWYLSTFGENNFYLEVQAHPELSEQVTLNQALRKLSQEFSLPLVATNDCHYLETSDREAQDILVCIQTGKKVTDEKRLDMRGLDTSLKTEAVMRQELPDFLDAIEQTGRLAAELKVELPLGQRFFPSFPTPQGETPEAYLRLQTEQGLAKHFPNGVEDKVRERLEYEMDIITKKGYASYFLVVADFVNWARAQKIIATTRGSAAGSLVSYLIGITTVNPLTYQLPFERFLNPHRPSPPDIDMDFADNRRDEVIAYVTAKYGVDQVAQIVTFGTMAARAAVRDVGRALGLPYGLCDRVAKLIPLGSQGFHMTIERALREAPELKNLTETDPQIRQLLSLAQKVEGCVRHASIHAAGVVISPTPLNDYVPLQYDVEGKHIITQYDMWSCEDVGLVKMDFLGIRNLSIMGSAVNIIKKTKGLDIDLAAIPLNDKKTYDLMAKGETMGIFQLGGSGMTRYLKELKPSTITDVMAMVALFRPGPMESLPEFIRRKHNPKAITYLDPRLKEILKDSYGIITYQDDVLMIAVKLAGYTWEEADKLRKAMGKKIPREMARQKEKFISGCIVGGLSETKANQLWELIEPFAAYGFNKAHAASYGIVAYQTAYLKANFPTEFMAALMTAESDDLPTVAQAVAECKRLNITVLPPDVNESLATFTVVNDKCIRFGLSAIKNLGAQVIENIIAERKLNGPFVSLVDFIERAARREFTKKSLESLIKCGALDSFGFDRGQLLAAMETLLSHAKNSQRAKIAKQSSLFGSSKTEHLTLRLPETPPASQKAKLTWEKEFLGLYVTKHPLQEYMTQLNGRVVPISELDSLSGEPMITIAGLVTATKAVTTKKGELMMFATLEDLNGTCELIAFPDTYRNERDKLVTDAIVAVRGRLSKKNGERKVIIESIISLPKAEETTKQLNAWLNGSNSSKPSDDQALTIILPADTSPEIMAELKKLLEHHSGKQRVVLEIKQTGKSQRVNTPYKVDPTPEFIKQCQSLLGYSSLPFTT